MSATEGAMGPGADGSGRGRDGLPPPRTRWQAVGAATLVLQVAYWPGVYAVSRLASGESWGPPLAFAFAMMPFVLICLVVLSRQERAPLALLLSMGAFVAIAVPMAFVDAVVAQVLGYGAAASIALRWGGGRWPLRRGVAVVLAGGYAYLLMRAAPALGMVTGAILPVAAVGFADEFARVRRALRG